MSTVLCLAATHLTALRPQDVKYANASTRLLSKSLRLLRQNLSRPFTKDTCDSIVGTAILVNYISWCHLDFLDGQRHNDAALDLSRDQLILLSPGVLQVFFQALPIFMAEKSDFLAIVHQHPRLNIEEALRKRGVDPARFVQPFMAIYDDPQYQTRGVTRPDKASGNEPSLHSWRFLLSLETELSSNDSTPSTRHTNAERVAKSLRVAAENFGSKNDPVLDGKDQDVVANVTCHARTSILPPDDSLRTAYELVSRRLSTLLSCILLEPVSDSDVHPAAMPSRADVQRFFFAFPILCSGTFAQMAVDGDSRALVLLFHFYRAARRLLTDSHGWWAAERARVLEALLLRELKSRGLSVCLRQGRDGELGKTCTASHGRN